MSAAYYAHTRPDAPPEAWDPVESHANRTAKLAAEFCASFAPKAGLLAGRWHDLGKFQPKFQAYLRRSAEAGHSESGPPHSIVGAWHAWRHNLPELAMAIAAHHGSLRAYGEFVNLIEAGARYRHDAPPNMLAAEAAERPPRNCEALWTRFLFSALVDADILDTEQWHSGKPRWRCDVRPEDLLQPLEAYLSEKQSSAVPSALNRLRAGVQQACRDAARNSPGAFRLTVPTGGGKTLASILFALHHASQHGLRRVIVVIPYTSIIDQTVDTYRAIFGSEAVLEHHSNVDPDREDLRSRLCAENWDSPIVVTTSVRFFETLYAAHKRNLRRLHNVAESVVILDEVQTFPLELIKPIRDALDRLTAHFRVTTVHCSATQPLLAQPEAAEIAPDPPALFAIARSRVTVRWPEAPFHPVTWEQLADRIRSHRQRRVLAIVHRKKDAVDLARAVGEDSIHLSTLMCAAHRRDVLRIIRKPDHPCIVVATQLVEAGVDLDFPVVYRALAGVDSLAQAAGRCNREGRLPEPGEFHVFVAPTRPPRGTLENGAKVMTSYLLKGALDLFDPGLAARYFAELKSLAGFASEIPGLERARNFPEVEHRFRMIDDEGTPVIAPYDGWQPKVAAVRAAPCRETFRGLQPYIVSLDHRFLTDLQARGCLEPLLPGLQTCWTVMPRFAAVYSQRFGFGGGDTPFLEI